VLEEVFLFRQYIGIGYTENASDSFLGVLKLNRNNMKNYLKANGCSFSKLHYGYIPSVTTDFKIQTGIANVFIAQIKGFGSFRFGYKQWNETEEESLYLELTQTSPLSKRQFIKLVKNGELYV
jgi:hypothetical protein